MRGLLVRAVARELRTALWLGPQVLLAVRDDMLIHLYTREAPTPEFVFAHALAEVLRRKADQFYYTRRASA